jgi:hypothetical protein
MWAEGEIRKMDIILTKFEPIIKSESQAFQMLKKLSFVGEGQSNKMQ